MAKLVDEPRQRIVLYYPELWQPQWPMWAPLDVFAIQTALMHAGYEVIFIDERIEKEAREWLRQELSVKPLFVGISGKFGDQCRNMMDAARFIKEVSPDTPVVAGGWFPSLFPEVSMTSDLIDYVVEGPGDFVVGELADRMLEGRSMEGLSGLWYRENGEIKKEPFGHLPPLADTHPIPWETVNIGRYIHPHGWLNYFSSRGCPGGCKFCAIYCLDPNRWTALPAERVVDEMEYLAKNLGVKALKVLDTDFCASERRVDEICKLILDRGLEIRFEVLGRHWNMRRLSDEQIKRLRMAGCTEIEVGVETGSQRLSDMIDKKCDVTEVYPVFKKFVEAGIRLKVNFMFGIPTETKQDLIDTFKVIRQLKSLGEGIRLQMFRYTPLPDAPMNKQVWEVKQRGHDGVVPETLEELLALPINDDPAFMFWVSESQERDVKRAYYFYAPLAYYRNSIEYSTLKKPIWRQILRWMKPLAEWRTVNGFYSFPIEQWLNRIFGNELPRGEDDGIGGPEDVLPAPFMGESYNRNEPLPVAEEEEKAMAAAASAGPTRPDGPIKHHWIQ